MNQQQNKIVKLSLLLIFAVVIPLYSQTSFTIPFSLTQSSPSIVFSLDSYGVLMAGGTENGSGILSSGEQGAGTRLLWYPGKAAFRAGNVTGTAWNDSNIGNYSIAGGQDTTASGASSFAAGYGTVASGDFSVAMGAGSSASGYGSLSLGNYNAATGYFAVALGIYSSADAQSIAIGTEATATNSSFALGIETVASGVHSSCLGSCTNAQAYAQTTMGIFNVGLSSTGGAPSNVYWVLTDPLFEIGNGTVTYTYPPGQLIPTQTINPSDAFVIYKNGNAVFGPPPGIPAPPAGTPTCTVSAPAFLTTTVGGVGDIPMYSGN